jgi:hypothetical protein
MEVSLPEMESFGATSRWRFLKWKVRGPQRRRQLAGVMVTLTT